MNEWQFSFQTPTFPLIILIFLLAGAGIGIWYLIKWCRTQIQFQLDGFMYTHYLLPYSTGTIPMQLRDGRVIGNIFRKSDYMMRLVDGYKFYDRTPIKGRIPIGIKIAIQETDGEYFWEFLRQR